MIVHWNLLEVPFYGFFMYKVFPRKHENPIFEFIVR